MLEEGNAKSSSTEPGSRAKTRMAALISYMSLPTKRAGNGGEAHKRAYMLVRVMLAREVYFYCNEKS